ncbi:MAG: HXXEE domain-containing protein [Pseudomonadota bacterium]
MRSSTLPKPNYLGLATLLVAFAMLWLPLGQYPFLIEHWMKVGTFMAPLLLFAAVADRGRDWRNDFVAMGLLLLLAYIAHQFEEHWIDVFGDTYAFYTSVNCLILDAVSVGCSAWEGDWPLTRASIFVINTALVWLVGCLAMLCAPRRIFPLLAMASITFVNGVAHVVLGLASWTYNPGLLTSVLLFVPLSVWVYRRVLVAGAANRRHIVASIVWAVLAHVLMVAGLLAANWYRLVPEVAYFIALVAWSVLPALIPGRGPA